MKINVWIVIYYTDSKFSRPSISGIYYSKKEANENAIVPRWEDINYEVSGPHTIEMPKG